MHCRKYIWTIITILLFGIIPTSPSFANTKTTAEEYIQKYKGIAISEMKKYGIPASIKLAQGLLESGIGSSKLAVQGNNHFGIKCHTVWTGPSMKHTDDAPNECFRVYSDPAESFKDHSQFLMSRPWYAPLFKLKTNDYKGWAYGLKKAGYATNPRYAEMLIDVIERHQLYVYDMDLNEREMESYRNQIVDEEKKALIALQKKDPNIDHSPVVTLPGKHTQPSIAHTGVVFYNNKVKVVRALKGQTLQDISKEHRISVSQLRKYNDMTNKQEIAEGQLVYLATKKKKASQKKHLVLSHETMWSISQNYGIQLNVLYEKNLLKKGEEPEVGTSLSLKKKLKVKPSTRKIIPVNNNPITVPVQSNPKESSPSLPAPPTTSNSTTVSKPKEPGINYHPFNYDPELPYPNTNDKNGIFHTVAQGETLYSISKKYGVSVDQIKLWNNIGDNSIQLHQQLIILK